MQNTKSNYVSAFLGKWNKAVIVFNFKQQNRLLTAFESTSLCIATVLIPNRLQVSITRHAISPRLATRIFLNCCHHNMHYYLGQSQMITRSFCLSV